MTLKLRTGASTEDAGFSLVEAVVAMVVFAVMVTAAVGILFRTLDVTRDNTHRVAAANLATKQIESARSQLAIKIPDGETFRTEAVAGTTYKVTQNASYIVSGTNTTLCESTGELAHKLVTVEVTWPNMGSVKPVRSDTVKALGVGDEGLNVALGAIAVGVNGADGGPVAGVVVTLMPGSYTRTTGPDGCAVFVGLPVAATGTDYVASVNQVGYVGANNTQYAQVSQGVSAGEVAQGDLLYDRTRSLNVLTYATAGFNPPAGLLVSGHTSYTIPVSGAVWPPCASAAAGTGCAGGFPGLARNLFPAVYEVWGGTCTHPRPVDEASNVDLTSADGQVTVNLQPVLVRVRNEDGDPISGADITVIGGCSTTSYPLAPTGANGTSPTALPPGTWTFDTTDEDVDPVTITIAAPVTGSAVPVLLEEGD